MRPDSDPCWCIVLPDIGEENNMRSALPRDRRFNR